MHRYGVSPACRTPNGAIPPTHHPSHGPTGPPRQLHRATPGRLPARPPLSGPHPATQRGVCTIRRIATACRRRVAPLMLQFPHSPPRPRPRPPPATANRATPRRERRQQRVWPQPTRPPRQLHPATTHPAARSATAHRPTPRRPTGGFCTIRRIATACRRRVAPLMLQFPPFARANRHLAHHQRRPIRPRPRTSQSPATTGGNFVLHQLFRQREIRPIHFVQTVTN